MSILISVIAPTPKQEMMSLNAQMQKDRKKQSSKCSSTNRRQISTSYNSSSVPAEPFHSTILTIMSERHNEPLGILLNLLNIRQPFSAAVAALSHCSLNVGVFIVHPSSHSGVINSRSPRATCWLCYTSTCQLLWTITFDDRNKQSVYFADYKSSL